MLQQGGAWVALAIEDGVGSFESGPVPTLGIQLRGQLRIWEEHTGNWHVVMRDLSRAEDPVILERLMVPGEPVDFDYQTGMLGQIQIDVRWSEARDTTLRVWVGTELTPGEQAEPESRRTASGEPGGQRYPSLLTFTDVYWNYAGRRRLRAAIGEKRRTRRAGTGSRTSAMRRPAPCPRSDREAGRPPPRRLPRG